MWKKLFGAALALALTTSLAIAQTSPGLTQNQKLTPAQWNALFAAKQDTLGYTPLNVAGGIMTGRLVTAAPGASTASFNLTPGTAPGSPTDGDMWATTAGVFVRINGSTIGPLASSGGTSFAGTDPVAVTFPGGIVTYALNYNATLALSGSNLAINLNNANTWTANQTFPNNSIALSKLSDLAANRVVGSIAGGAPSELTATQLTTLVNPFTATLSGAVNPPTTATGKFLRDDNTWQAVAGAGTVTSVDMTVPSILSVSGNPITTSGTLALSLATQSANRVFAGPTSGGAAAPTFRALVNNDFPSGFVIAGTGLTGGSLVGGGTIAIDAASSSNYYAGTADKVVATGVIYPSEVTVTYGATTTFDFNTFINANVTLTGNISTQTLSNVKAGKAGSIRFTQDATGSRTTVWNTIFKFPGGTTPTLSTTASAIDVLNYNCITATYCQASLSKDVR